MQSPVSAWTQRRVWIQNLDICKDMKEVALDTQQGEGKVEEAEVGGPSLREEFVPDSQELFPSMTQSESNMVDFSLSLL